MRTACKCGGLFEREDSLMKKNVTTVKNSLLVQIIKFVARGIAKEDTFLGSRIKFIMRFQVNGKAKTSDDPEMITRRKLAI